MTTLIERLDASQWLARYMDLGEVLSEHLWWLIDGPCECGWYRWHWQPACPGCGGEELTEEKVQEMFRRADERKRAEQEEWLRWQLGSIEAGRRRDGRRRE